MQVLEVIYLHQYKKIIHFRILPYKHILLLLLNNDDRYQDLHNIYNQYLQVLNKNDMCDNILQDYENQYICRLMVYHLYYLNQNIHIFKVYKHKKYLIILYLLNYYNMYKRMEQDYNLNNTKVNNFHKIHNNRLWIQQHYIHIHQYLLNIYPLHHYRLYIYLDHPINNISNAILNK